MMSSVMPSLKYSCSASPLMLVNGRTAIDAPSPFVEVAAAAGHVRGVSRHGMSEARHVDPYRPLDVLHGMFTEILELGRKLAADVLAYDTGDRDAAGIGERLQARRDIDPVTIDVLTVNDDVTEIDTDTIDKAAVLGLLSSRANASQRRKSASRPPENRRRTNPPHSGNLKVARKSSVEAKARRPPSPRCWSQCSLNRRHQWA
ncbi:hypothetical protein [Sinorhizobium numidicum]|uniref:hypothetical protein n=1 Tax=Sinorhizobium numidicum TaxID=680248 RepID=UPI003CC84329